MRQGFPESESKMLGPDPSTPPWTCTEHEDNPWQHWLSWSSELHGFCLPKQHLGRGAGLKLCQQHVGEVHARQINMQGLDSRGTRVAPPPSSHGEGASGVVCAGVGMGCS
eukprot:3454177-Amphidinium_carterae.1